MIFLSFGWWREAYPVRGNFFCNVAGIPKESIEQVLRATDIVDLVQTYVPLKRAGTQFRANCPFHSEKSPSFYVNPARQSFKCFGCGKGGDAITFVRDYENLPFMDAVRRLAQKAGIQIREEEADPMADQARRSKGKLLDLHREATEFLHEQLMKSPDAAHAREYVKSRGFGRAMVEGWRIGWMPENSNVFLEWAKSKKFSGRELEQSGMCYLRDAENPRSGLRVRFRDRLMFPVRNEIGDVIAFSGRQLRVDPNSGKYVNSPETAIFIKSRVLYALDRARKPILNEKAALLCEGQLDVISCHEAGVLHAIAPLGTAFTEDHARLLKRYTGHVLACYDADKAGVLAAERLFRVIAPHGLSMRVACLPEGDDPDTYIKTHGVDAFRGLLAEAKEFFDFKLEQAKKIGLLEQPATRNAAMQECVEILAGMADMAARENAINSVVAHLQMSSQALRDEIGRIRSRPQRQAIARDAGGESKKVVKPTPMNKIVAYLCHLALSSATAQHFLADQFETLHEASAWLEGVVLLESILVAAPDCSSPAAVNSYLGGLSEGDRLALLGELEYWTSEIDGLQSAEHALALLSAIVLQRRAAAVQAALKESGLSRERILALMEQAQEIEYLMRGIGQRCEFDDELPKSTYKPKEPEWKKRWRDKQGDGER